MSGMTKKDIIAEVRRIMKKKGGTLSPNLRLESRSKEDLLGLLRSLTRSPYTVSDTEDDGYPD